MKIKQIMIGILAVGLILAPAFIQAADIDPTNLPSEVVLFKNVKVFNGKDDKLNDVDVLVVGNKIHKVEKNIPTSGTYEIDVQQNKVKEIPIHMPMDRTYSVTVLTETSRLAAVSITSAVTKTFGTSLSTPAQPLRLMVTLFV